MRLATWNVNSITARLPRVTAWLAAEKPDVLCLQEIKIATADFPTEAFAELGYQVAAHGDGRWNGVAVASRIGVEDVRRSFAGQPPYPEDGPVEARAVGVRCGALDVWSVYVPNGRSLESDHYPYKLRWLAALRDSLAGGGVADTVVCGDFNVAPTDDDVWDPEVFAHSTHVTDAERTALARLRELGLTDVLPRSMKGPHPFTYWDYRAGAFPKNLGMRIDLVYAGSRVAGAVSDAWVDREARKGTGPSDHAPIVVEVDDAGLAGTASASS